MIDLHVVEAKPADAPYLVEVIHAAFGARPPLDPPGTAMQETAATVEAAVREYGGLLARVDGEPAGAILFSESTPISGSTPPRDDSDPDGGARWLELRRVSVHPRFQHRGVATAMVGCAEEVAEGRSVDGVRLVARAELPATLAFWRHRGYVEAGRSGPNVALVKRIPVEFAVPTATDMRAVGERLAGVVRPGDLVLLAGELGAGKTTLTQGLGAGLAVRGEVTSPTFVISRVHPSTVSGPPLVHVDAYRLGGVAELDDLDLDMSLDEAVTVVEWGEGLAEGLAEDRLEVVLTRSTGAAAGVPSDGESADPRWVRIIPVGRRWVDAPLRASLSPDAGGAA
ncbi:bifunctional acetyltransferase/tRNA (adenosine(37)-N6)-threonylcarbamoyltransferase complex ATPase subunit type 1 TsaE [Actinopolymorpha alba]|uniref:bifunctional acetyltransferase/tRNA (adenosine(37)-N6)-threonylcarbamoyltransferase complex ATPase subunit type 1 TsaE n=1 Tax=Actinopolymorpha alba TaxID=533267 RepID=UPI000369E83C|nr:bifunctional acetyltransferase/tRNA (adenosine(37)-N6)-threonylcarbamoyltransferase complex ATPase subunit type 1 TsaE [Actinopolymorpha alba]